MSHNYTFKCDCWVCKGITDHFHLKSEKEAKELYYQT